VRVGVEVAAIDERPDFGLEQTRRILRAQEAWNETIREALRGLPPMSVPDVHEWLALVPRIPPTPGDQVLFAARWAGRAGVRVSGPLGVGKPKTKPKPVRRGRGYRFTERQLEIAAAVLAVEDARQGGMEDAA